MAETVSAWGKPGAWALDAEENEAELLHQPKEDSSVVDGLPSGGEAAEFPSLAAASTAKTKKKKPQTLSLQEFSSYGVAKPVTAAQLKGLTLDELSLLPTGPRQRSVEELDRTKLGGGFRSYGSGARDEQPRRQGSFNRDSDREFTPSRADETDDWGVGKKSPVNNGFDRRNRGERGGISADSQSRADEVDNWASNKSFVPSEPRRPEKRGDFGLDTSNGGADSSNWVKRKEEEGRKTGGAFDSLRERKGGFESNVVDSESWGKKREEASSGSRPRLNLQPRTLPVTEVEKSENIASVVKPKGSSSPFGEARPREEVLKEKGHDLKEIDEKLESVKIKEVVSVGPSDGPALEKKSFWSGNGKERSWRRPELDNARPQSAGETENGPAENTGNGDTR
ncbi:hypothetical protein DH2020_045356 [Rehmannia glutinosa]|uniref:Eukaryotic translation initiation factor 4B3-like n=1 Tax=Rehmannia glutinosa TaxID=99300 RepID=A0ABR0UF08_REHGL